MANKGKPYNVEPKTLGPDGRNIFTATENTGEDNCRQKGIPTEIPIEIPTVISIGIPTGIPHPDSAVER